MAYQCLSIPTRKVGKLESFTLEIISGDQKSKYLVKNKPWVMICCKGNKYKYIIKANTLQVDLMINMNVTKTFFQLSRKLGVFWKGTKFSTSGLRRSALHLHFGFLLLCRAHFLLPHVLQASHGVGGKILKTQAKASMKGS